MGYICGRGNRCIDNYNVKSVLVKIIMYNNLNNERHNGAAAPGRAYATAVVAAETAATAPATAAAITRAVTAAPTTIGAPAPTTLQQLQEEQQQQQ